MVNEKKGFFNKYYKEIKWGLRTYYILFSCWAFYLIIQILIRSIGNIWYAIPLIIFVLTSSLGGYKIFSNPKHGVNLLIIAQIPQVLVLQLNGFVYSLFVGQWFVIGLNGFTKVISFAGLFDVQFQLLFLKNKLPESIVGINLVPIIIILILLKIEEQPNFNE